MWRWTHRYAWAAISEWQCRQGVTQRGRVGPVDPPRPSPRSSSAKSLPLRRLPIRRTRTIGCMTQLQAKQVTGFGTDTGDVDAADHVADDTFV